MSTDFPITYTEAAEFWHKAMRRDINAAMRLYVKGISLYPLYYMTKSRKVNAMIKNAIRGAARRHKSARLDAMLYDMYAPAKDRLDKSVWNWLNRADTFDNLLK